jgi:hypothetical protein
MNFKRKFKLEQTMGRFFHKNMKRVEGAILNLPVYALRDNLVFKQNEKYKSKIYTKYKKYI